MLDAVIIILRESLEASILISLLVVLHLKLHFYRHWMPISLLFGFACAYLYSISLSDISAWFAGSGQEVVNGFALLIISICLVCHNVYINYLVGRMKIPTNTEVVNHSFPLVFCAILVITITMTREGSEAFVYYTGLNAHPQKAVSMIVGGIIGAGLGCCIGILIFALLYNIAYKTLIFITSFLFVLISSGMVLEATQSFIQAGWFIPHQPVWDTSSFIPESSIVGQFLYATFFYEATPTPEEISVWGIFAVAHATLIYGARHFFPSENNGDLRGT
jgi:high-affinity iron transporter